MSNYSSDLVIFHTNDLHSHFARMAPIARIIRQESSDLGTERRLVLDIGDHMDRFSPITEGSAGAANIAVMNAVGYDAAVPGNNEGLTFVRSTLAERYGAQAHFPVLGTNMASPTGERPEWLKPYLILEKSGMSIGILGVTAAFNTFYRLLGWEIADPVAAVKNWAQRLRSQVDLLLVLSHVGLKLDQRMAEEVPEVDLILGGHTHHLLEQPQRIGNTYLAAAGYGGEYLGILRLRYDRANGRLQSVTGEARRTEGAAPDPIVSEIIDRYRQESDRNLQRVAAEIPHPLPHQVAAESPLGNLLAIAVRRHTGAEVGLINAGQLLGPLEAGPISVGRLLGICPSPINPCRLYLTGAQIREALEQSLDQERIQRRFRGFGFRGRELGALCLDGAEALYEAGDSGRGKLLEVRIGGEALEAGREYAVGTLDMFTFGAGYPSLGQGRELTYYLPEFIRDLLAAQLRDPEALRDCMVPRWHAAQPGRP